MPHEPAAINLYVPVLFIVQICIPLESDKLKEAGISLYDKEVGPIFLKEFNAVNVNVK